MRNSRVRFGLAIAALLAFASPAFADTTTYKCDLKGADEVPPNDSKASGTVEGKYDSSSMKFAYTVTYKGLSGPATAAHFHGPAKPGANAGPVITLSAPLDSPITGEGTLTKAQADDLANGMWYLNVHTAAHPPGEIRCQLKK
jgi:CHRD domain-containing protein